MKGQKFVIRNGELVPKEKVTGWYAYEILGIPNSFIEDNPWTRFNETYRKVFRLEIQKLLAPEELVKGK